MRNEKRHAHIIKVNSGVGWSSAFWQMQDPHYKKSPDSHKTFLLSSQEISTENKFAQPEFYPISLSSHQFLIYVSFKVIHYCSASHYIFYVVAFMHNEDASELQRFYQLKLEYKCCLRAIYGIYFFKSKKRFLGQFICFRENYAT